jgi:hypothetical protein
MVVTGLDKVFVVNAETNTRYGGVDPTGEFVTINDLAPQPYKVYTAILSQSGGGDPIIISSGVLTIGLTYQIVHDGPIPGDFTNVGAPNNNDDTFFIATGTTPNSWGNYNLRYNTGAPVVTVLENTIGNVWFTYQALGEYRINSDNLFTIDKTYFQIVVMSNAPTFLINNLTLDFIELIPTDGDGSLNNTPIEIRVYN